MDSVFYFVGKRVFILSFLLSLAACGGESETEGGSEGSVSGSKAKLIKLNGAIYSLADSQLKRIDISTPGAPLITDSINVVSDADAITHDGGAIYVASSSVVQTYQYNELANRLEFIDDSIPRRAISDPVVSDGGYAYSTVITRENTDVNGQVSGNGDLYVYEVDAAKNLSEINRVQNLGFVQGLALWKESLFICDPTAGLLQLNVSNPMLVEIVHQIDFVLCDDILHLGDGHFATVGEQGIHQLMPYNGSKLALISIYN